MSLLNKYDRETLGSLDDVGRTDLESPVIKCVMAAPEKIIWLGRC